MKKWYTAREIIKYFNITAQTLYNWRKAGKISYRKIGDINNTLFFYENVFKT